MVFLAAQAALNSQSTCLSMQVLELPPIQAGSPPALPPGILSSKLALSGYIVEDALELPILLPLKTP